MAHEHPTDSLQEILDKAEEHLKNYQYEQAEKLGNDALTQAKRDNQKGKESRALCIIGECSMRTGRFQEALRQCQSALAAAEAVSNLALQARAHNGIARTQYWNGDDPPTAIRNAEYALDLAERANDDYQRAWALIILGCIRSILSDTGRASEHFEHALRVAEKIGNKSLMGLSLNNIGYIHYASGDYPRALECSERALALSEEVDDKRGVLVALHHLGDVNLELADYPRAHGYLIRALSLAEALSEKTEMTQLLTKIGCIHESLADYPRALEYMSGALVLAEEIGSKRLIETSLYDIATLHEELGDYPRALGCFNRCLSIAEENGEKKEIAPIHVGYGHVYTKMGDYPRALKYFESALDLSEENGYSSLVGFSMEGIADAEYHLGNLEKALLGYLNTLHYRRNTLRSSEGVSYTLCALGCVLIKQGKIEEGLVRLEESRVLAEELGEKRVIAECHKELASAYEKLGDITEAYQHHQKYYALEKEILSEKTRQQFDTFNIRAAIADKERDAELQRLKAERSEQELRLKERELANTASSLAAQTELLGNFRTDLRKIVLKPDSYGPEDIVKKVREKLKDLPCEMIDFAKFEAQFATVHPEFRAMLGTKHSDLTPQEVKICLLIHVNLHTAEIARLTCISERTVDNHRFNIRKKLGLKTEDSLPEFLRTLDGAKILSST